MKIILLLAIVLFAGSTFYLTMRDITWMWARAAYPTYPMGYGSLTGLMTGLMHFSLTVIVAVMIWEFIKIILPIIKKKREQKHKTSDDK